METPDLRRVDPGKATETVEETEKTEKENRHKESKGLDRNCHSQGDR